MFDPSVPLSSLPEIKWPAVPTGPGATVLAMLFQLEQSQWWGPEALREHQFAQLDLLVEHAFRTVPFYRERLAATGYAEGIVLTPEMWASVPVLTRAELQNLGKTLRSRSIPAGHGKVREIRSSGSTGTPVTVYHTQLNALLARALTVRGRLWHRLDPAKTLCVIRDATARLERAAGGAHLLAYPHGLQHDRWLDAIAEEFPTGRGSFLPIQTHVAQQVEWLQRQDPHYLRTFSSNALAVARYCSEHGIELPRLECVLVGAEPLTAEVRATCREVWDVPVIDHYGAREADWLAIQCPDYEHLHVQAEGALLEVLDEHARPCEPGEVGRIVVTPLHNFAMPLLRHALCDYAEAGSQCECGRGLPVLTRIFGRSRNMLRLPSGEHFWPSILGHEFQDVAPVRQFQLVQWTLEDVELRLVVERPLTSDEESDLRAMVAKKFGHPFNVTLTYHGELPRTASGKFEDFRSELEA